MSDSTDCFSDLFFKENKSAHWFCEKLVAEYNNAVKIKMCFMFISPFFVANLYALSSLKIIVGTNWGSTKLRLFDLQ